MLNKTSAASPWLFVDANNKKKTRLECIRYVLSSMDYDGKNSNIINHNFKDNVIKFYNSGNGF
jgi:polyphosphate kinase